MENLSASAVTASTRSILSGAGGCIAVKCDHAMITTVGIVEDDAVLRNTLWRLVGDTRGLRCVSACASGEEALQKLPALKPEVVLMDLNLPQMSGAECIRHLKEALPKTQVIVLTVYEDSEHIFRALKA